MTRGVIFLECVQVIFLYQFVSEDTRVRGVNGLSELDLVLDIDNIIYGPPLGKIIVWDGFYSERGSALRQRRVSK